MDRLKRRRKAKILKRKRILFALLSVVIIIGAVFIGRGIYKNVTKDRVKDAITIEAGSVMVGVEEFLIDKEDSAWYVTKPSNEDLMVPGTYPIEVELEGRFNNKVFKSSLNVVDTTAPVAEVKDLSIKMPSEVKADDFIVSVEDLSEVSISFDKEPDYTKAGIQEVSLLVEDEFNNKSIIKANIDIIIDTTPPTIEGTKDKTVFVGDSISYRDGVIVVDDIDEKVDLKIDNSQVDLNKPGQYTVLYSATDSSGNTATQEISITVKEIVVVAPPKPTDNRTVQEKVFNYADKVLSEITNPSMSVRDKTRKIFDWVKKNISYLGSSPKTDWVTGAHTGFNDKRGDCFIYFAVTKALLERAGIPNVDITRVGGRTNHYWHLVDVGQGWYHLDTTPQKDYLEVFLLNDAAVEAYTARSSHNYYTFDKDLYPERGE